MKIPLLMNVERTDVRRLTFGFISLVVLLIQANLNAGEWLQYRGPNHDGIVTENIRINWSQEPPRQVWKVPLEDALSSFTIGGGRAFTQVRRPGTGPDQEYCIALDAGTGQELWATRLDLADYDSGAGEGDGPRSTPSVDGDRVYILTSQLKMACLEAATGQVVWNKDLVSEFGGRVITWQNAASPLIVGDLIFVNGNAPNQRLMALRKQDGSVLWKGQNDAMTQATPVAATIADVPQVIFFAQSGLVSVAPETGAVLWRYAFPYSTSTAASPVVANDVVYCSAAYGMGAGAVRVTKNGSGLVANEIWRTPGDNMNHWATPVHHEGYLYGNYGHTLVSLRCIDLATGVEKWRQNGVGRGGVLFVSGHILALAEDGNLIVVKPDPSSYREVARFKAVRGKCWNVPAVSGGRIYARSTSEAVCLDVAVALKLLPRLKFYPTFAKTGDSFSLLLGNEDDSPLDLSRLAKIDIFATSDLALGFSAWIKLANAGVLTNGQLRLDAQSSTEPWRFFRAQERP